VDRVDLRELQPAPFRAVGDEHGSPPRDDLTADELDASAVVHNALILLHHAARARGLKLTATGNLARSVVAEMIDLFDWPDFDKMEARQLNKVTNEPDFLTVHFVRLSPRLRGWFADIKAS
jgi:hypothetical protein